MSPNSFNRTKAGTDDRDAEADLRDRFPEVVQRCAQKAKVLHLPDPDAEEPEPRCDRHTSIGWRTVAVDSFPQGHREFCEYCVERFRENPREKYGNALKSDW